MFRDRDEAGARLGAVLGGLQGLQERDPVVIALPRGGVPIGRAVASALQAPLDVLVVRKLAAPANPELGFGAMCEDGPGGVVVIDEDTRARCGVDDEELRAIIAAGGREIARRAQRYRGGRPMIAIEGRTVVLVDDGLATGGTARAAVAALRAKGARRIVVAVPTGSAQAVDLLEQEGAEVVCLEIPPWFGSVGQQYEAFPQVSDEEVVLALHPSIEREVRVPIGPDAWLTGHLSLPRDPRVIVLFAHGSGSSRHSPRNTAVARHLNAAQQGTLLIDLLTPAEAEDRAAVFDIALLAARVRAITAWLRAQPETQEHPIAYFGASTGAAAALVAASGETGICAVVSRGGRPDLAREHLASVTVPTLLIVGSRDTEVLALNEAAARRMPVTPRIAIVDGATHLFEEPGTLEEVAELARDWIAEHAAPSPRAAAG